MSKQINTEIEISLPVECLVIHVDGMIELGNHHLEISTLIIDSGKSHQCLEGENLKSERAFM